MTAMVGPRRIPDFAELVEIVHELVDDREHRQSFRAAWARPNRTGAVIKDHVTRQQSLLNQLRDAVTDRADVTTGHAGRLAYTALPRFSADAYDRLESIRSQIADWCATLGIGSEGARRADLIGQYLDHVDRLLRASRINTYSATAAIDVLRQTAGYLRSSIEVDLGALVHHVAGLHEGKDETVAALATDADRWRTWCRIVGGWETPALRPHVPCPHCGTVAGERAGLRVRIDGASGAGGIVDDAAVRAAVCLTCNRTWDADTVGLLAEQLRQAERQAVQHPELDTGQNGDDSTAALLDGVA